MVWWAKVRNQCRPFHGMFVCVFNPLILSLFEVREISKEIRDALICSIYGDFYAFQHSIFSRHTSRVTLTHQKPNIFIEIMGNTTDGEVDQQAINKAAQNAANDKEVQDAMRSAAKKPEVQSAAKSAMKDPDVKNAMVKTVVGTYTNDPNQAQNNRSLWTALAKNKDVQNAAVTVAKDEKVQKAAWNQAKKNAPLMKSAAVGAFKMGFKAYKTSNNTKTGSNK
eukprot:352384_1